MDARFLDHPRDRMVDAAIAGMRTCGLAGAGINQVVAASGAPKGSLYHYFPGGKLELAREALERFGEQRLKELQTALSGDGPPDQKVQRLFKRAAKGLVLEDFRYGCAVAGVTLDLDDDSALLGPVCSALLESWAQALSEAFGALPPARRRLLARFVITVFEGALVQARAARSTQPMLEAGECAASVVRAEISST
jgi:TetR/AcrR family transcriptional repressor of lmrAB and yxaGH operons